MSAMRNALLSGIALAWGGLVVAMGACGGKVVFDGAPGDGAGGAGGATTSATTGTFSTATTTTTSGPTVSSSVTTSSGPGCSCPSACNTMQACGLIGPECQAFCGDFTPQQTQCVCQNAGSCFAVEQCFSGTGPGPSAVSSTGQGTGGGIPGACQDCGDVAVQGACAMVADQCVNSAECAALLQCLDGCGYTYPCINKCSEQHPNGFEDFYYLIDCVVCQECYPPCAGTTLASFCGEG